MIIPQQLMEIRTSAFPVSPPASLPIAAKKGQHAVGLAAERSRVWSATTIGFRGTRFPSLLPVAQWPAWTRIVVAPRAFSLLLPADCRPTARTGYRCGHRNRIFRCARTVPANLSCLGLEYSRFGAPGMPGTGSHLGFWASGKSGKSLPSTPVELSEGIPA